MQVQKGQWNKNCRTKIAEQKLVSASAKRSAEQKLRNKNSGTKIVKQKLRNKNSGTKAAEQKLNGYKRGCSTDFVHLMFGL